MLDDINRKFTLFVPIDAVFESFINSAKADFWMIEGNVLTMLRYDFFSVLTLVTKRLWQITKLDISSQGTYPLTQRGWSLIYRMCIIKNVGY